MALVKCPECGLEISDQAVSCPGCGKPSKKAETTAYQLTVPQEEYKSSVGTYLRCIGGLTWVIGLICSILLAMVKETYQGYYVSTTFNFWFFLLYLVIFFVAGCIPFFFAQFFDDVHTIRCTLQGMSLTQAEQKGKTTVVGDKYVCNSCGKQYAKFYDACPFCGQKN